MERALWLLPALACAAFAAPAVAGRFHVFSCRMPGGQPAPADGWSAGSSGDGVTERTCEGGGALTAALPAMHGRMANVDSATWSFEAPAQERLAGARLWRAGDVDGGSNGGAGFDFWFSGPELGSTPFAPCSAAAGCGAVGTEAEPLSAANLVEVPGSALGGRLYADVACVGIESYPCPEGSSDAQGDAAALRIYAADLVIEQEAGPTVSGVEGELASAESVSGTSDVAFSASDPASGVYEALFSVDGEVVQASALAEGDAHCRDVGGAGDGLAAFLWLEPCPASLSADVGLDTTRIANGSHHLVVTVTDAAGNSATVLDREITVENDASAGQPAQPNGAGASAQATLEVRWAGAKGLALSVPFGRSERIEGRLLTSAGEPISGALLEASATPAAVGATVARLAALRTDSQGRFSMVVPAGAGSRTIAIAYRARLGEAQAAATAALALTVRAGIVLQVSPHTVSVGNRIRFRGRLEGGSVPGDGKQLVLEARAPGGRWIEFDDIRSGRSGRFAASYRFRFPGPVHYQFRVLSEAESDYPFARGSSNVVGVFER